MTKLEPLIKALIKTLKEANTTNLTNTQFECYTPECLQTTMDSLDIEPGTVIYVGNWEAMRVVGNGSHNELAWVGFDGRTYTHEEFAKTARSTQDIVRIIHYGVI